MKKQTNYIFLFIAIFATNYGSACHDKKFSLLKLSEVIKKGELVGAIERKVENLKYKLLKISENPFTKNEKLKKELEERLDDTIKKKLDLENEYNKAVETYEKKLNTKN